MKKIVIAMTIGMLAATAPVAAHASGTTFKGGCAFATLNDTTPGGVLGGQDVWNGEVDAEVVPTDAAGTPNGAAATVNCELKVNGGDRGSVLTASGTGVIVGAARLTFTAAATDTVSLCTTVTQASGSETVCDDATTTPICPDQVCGDGGLLDQVIAILDSVNEATKVLDPAVCSVLVTAAPTIDGLPTSGLLYIDPATGDTYVGGTDPASLFWDCPPYVVA